MAVFLTGSWLLESGIPSLSPARHTLASDGGENTGEMTEKYLNNLPKGFLIPTDDVGKLILHEYGSLFVARDGAVPPKTVIFHDEQQVQAFQASVEIGAETFGGTRIELQQAAVLALRDAIAEARGAGLSISPRGSDSGRRRYGQTVDLWASRVVPGMKHWVAAGRVSEAESKRILKLSPVDQVPEILSLEKQGIYFAKDLSKSIIYSVAPPGTSQHLSMLALDVKEFDNAEVRAILSRHGWFQTVTSDLPHFTYLGSKEADLAKLGLKSVVNAGRVFWVPDLK